MAELHGKVRSADNKYTTDYITFYTNEEIGGGVSELPTPSSENLGKIYQYIGTTTADYTQGYFYKCIENSGVYSWSNINVQPGGAGGNATWGGITGDLDNQIDLKYRLEEIEETYNSEAQPLVCGQPMVIFGAGAISADNIPFNWIDAEHGGYDWGGQAAFAGQVYVNISGNNSNNKYVACPSTKGGYDLTWK